MFACAMYLGQRRETLQHLPGFIEAILEASYY